MFSRVGSAVNLPSSLTPSVGSGANRLTDKPAGAHQHQPTRPVGVVERESHRGAAAERITHQCSAFDAEVVEQVQQRGGAVPVVLLVLGVLVGMPVAGLIDRQHVEVPRQYRDVLREVRPARRTGTAAVQEHNGLIVAHAGFVVVQAHVIAHLRVARGRLEGDLLLLCSFGGERSHQTIVSPGGSPNSWLPKIR